MGRHNHYHHKHQHHHYHDAKSKTCSGRKGPIYRVTSGIGKKLGVGRKWVLAGFILGLIINAPLTLIAFLICLFWIDHPGKLERGVETAKEKMRDTFAAPPSAHRHAYAGTADNAPGSDPERDANFDFAGLRRKFDDLEQRAGDMESHVSSDEYHVNAEINKMKDKKDR